MSEETTEQQPQSLQINDLMKVLEILNVCSQRGAIRPDEMTVVGGVYERIFQFLDASGVFERAAEQELETQEASAE